jgi:hypothetical protein
VAQVGQEVHIRAPELQATRHGWKYRAEPLTVAARIADLHLACHLGLRLRHHRLPVGQIARLLREGVE